jgi:hypothetical protein
LVGPKCCPWLPVRHVSCALWASVRLP